MEDLDEIERSRLVGRLRKLTRRDKRLISELKCRETPAEAALWERLRDNQVLGMKFRRQHKIGRFILDFFCIKALLAIEVDGSIHSRRKLEDAARTRWLESLGIRVIRFSNYQVLKQADLVTREIEKALARRLPISSGP